MAKRGKMRATGAVIPPTPTQQIQPPQVSTNAATPVRSLDSQVLMQLGLDLNARFGRYSSNRLLSEQKWIRNLRQYLGIYDPDVDKMLAPNQSRAYPRLTRVKCISTLARVMNLMFPGDEDNWEIQASPTAELNPLEVKQAVQQYLQSLQQQSNPGDPPPQVTDDLVDEAVQRLVDQRAESLSNLIRGQLQEIGGDQTLDYVSLNRKVIFSGILYGLGVLEGPFTRSEMKTTWHAVSGGYKAKKTQFIHPMYQFTSVWDYYPDLTAKNLQGGEGYFIRKVMGRSQVRQLANRDDFFGDQIKAYLKQNTQGNYVARTFETELKTLGTKAQVNDQNKQPHGNYEVLVFKGPVSAKTLMDLGVDVPKQYQADDVDAEIWLIENNVIKADINRWRKLGCDVRTIHTFIFDEDDTAPVGNGLPNIMRDSQMSICAATRMALDNGSVVCGPNIEVNLALLRAGQDTSSVYAYKVWERDDEGASQQFPAVREIEFNSHINELSQLIKMFMDFADLETFVGPATGGDMEQLPSEPMRTAAGASMLYGNAALPFKDIIRNYDFFTQSVILSLVWFNRKFNPGQAQESDYDVIAKGATSLIAKEVRGIQTDLLAQTLTPDERDWVDEEKFIRARLATRDMTGFMVSSVQAMNNRKNRTSFEAQQGQAALEAQAAETKKTTADAFKAVTQGQKNTAGADAATSKAALDIVGHAVNGPENQQAANQ